ncbi:thiamine monophosphate synthase [Sphingomonas sp. Leaf339]|uniref:thiamine phosphate synthase n=1 Tax=Sphingomonas sp. Leaf339 TaxID=1736343 RepID=UPI0006FB029B|nr:thiamine phosphate synthase [Sphingomonas sp. Leaf339]KQU52968.1 thiamine monophosphate synthase [Sphingomonas sp. Leaf339]
MTDERLEDRLWSILLHMPPGSGVVFRHRATRPAERRALFQRVRRITRARRLVLLAVDPPLPGSAGRHGRVAGATSWPAHDRVEAIAGFRAGAKLLFVSPLYATRSHSGAAALGPIKARRIGQGLGISVIAMGGMDARRWRRIRHLGFTGWAGIDAWPIGPSASISDRQKRKAVPT